MVVVEEAAQAAWFQVQSRQAVLKLASPAKSLPDKLSLQCK
jgi:hypothetical protein